jgi:hypothetical protein
LNISDEYQKQIRFLHDSEKSFGGGSSADIVAEIISTLKINSLSDYGAGKKELENRLVSEFGIEINYSPYDPAFPEYGVASSADLVCCIEVLEHIEPEFLKSVLDQLATIIIKYGFFTVHCGPSSKFLPDGRNAHLIQKPISWWLPNISEYFEIQWLRKTSTQGFAILVSPKENDYFQLNQFEVLQFASAKQQIRVFKYLVIREIKRRLRLRKTKTDG